MTILFPKIIAFVVLLFLFCILLPLAKLLRLAPALVYLLVVGVSTLFTDFVTRYERFFFLILVLLLLITLLQWLFSLTNAVKQRFF